MSAKSAAGAGAHLGAENGLTRLLASPLGVRIARPWFDRTAIFLLDRWYFPLSRLWAAAGEAGGDVERFAAAIPLDPGPGFRDRARDALVPFGAARQRAAAADARWEEAFFGAASVDDAALVAAETDRIGARHGFMASRRHFTAIAASQDVPPVRWAVPTPDEVDARYGHAMYAPERIYAAPETMPGIEVSRRVPGPAGAEYWVRFPSPSTVMGDTAWARVYEPADVADPPTLIFGHGVCVEFDHWRRGVDEVAALVAMGIRVIRPEAPWHGRRTRPGYYGGEPFIATSPAGALDLFSAQVREQAVLIDMVRQQSAAPVAVGGSSLGALVAQLTGIHATAWPGDLKPDAMFLITHCGRLEEVALDSSLSRAFGLAEATLAAGWTMELLEKWLPLTNPVGAPAVDPGSIVSVLGRCDDVTPFADGMDLVDEWGIPEENLFVAPGGHFSVPVGMIGDHRPLFRLKAVLEDLGRGMTGPARPARPVRPVRPVDR